MFLLDYGDSRPLYEQIRDKLRELTLRGLLPPHQQLPSVRDLAAMLTVNPNTIQKAYRELELEGYIYSVRGKGNFVAEKNPDLLASQALELQKELARPVIGLRHLGVALPQVQAWVAAAYTGERMTMAKEGAAND